MRSLLDPPPGRQDPPRRPRRAAPGDPGEEPRSDRAGRRLPPLGIDVPTCAPWRVRPRQPRPPEPQASLARGSAPRSTGTTERGELRPTMGHESLLPDRSPSNPEPCREALVCQQPRWELQLAAVAGSLLPNQAREAALAPAGPSPHGYGLIVAREDQVAVVLRRGTTRSTRSSR